MIKKTLLFIADDDTDDQLLMSSAVEECALPFQIVFFNNGESLWQELLKLEKDQMRLPDIIMADLNMPKLNGAGLLSNVRNHELLKAIPFIILSTSSAPNEVKKAYQDGANAFICKPTSYTDLGDVFKHLYQFFCRSAQLPK